ncbi:MAG: F0F1 ATP synthase subunit B [Paracoccaceae bacterium]
MNALSRITVIALLAGAQPALAASEPFFSLNNTHTVVLFAFLLFVAILVYLKVPGMLAKMLDSRAVEIEAELNEARSLREEAQTILASYERKQKEVAEHAAGIVAHAKIEAEAAAEAAKEDLRASIARRLQAAEDQIASAEATAVKDVRDRAISVAVAAASDVIAKNMTAKDGGVLIEAVIKDVGQKLH